MSKFKTFTVVPKLPEPLEKLWDIANNLWWTWEPEAVELFLRLDRDLWQESCQSPIRVLGMISQLRLDELAQDRSYLAHLDRVAAKLEDYSDASWRDRWHEKNSAAPEDFTVAYLSLEFGLHESCALYSGGLGLLAGDHLRSASDLGLPLVAIGFLYREGYFRQYLSADGWQQESNPRNEFHNMPVERVRDEAGVPLTIEVDYPERPVKAQVWKCMVGRVPLYLLDCDIEENHKDDREITGRLYGGDLNQRIRQELMLGMGGVKALRAIGVNPTVYHMNEGHAAFMTLQRMKDLIKQEGLTFAEAAESIRAASVFTTHTPVPAGNDVFPPEMIAQYFSKFASDCGIALDDLLALGRQDASDKREPFCMTVLAIKLSTFANGVSKLHGEVARGMWSRIWEGLPKSEVPITSITNGVHTRFWISRDLAGLYDRYLGPDWAMSPEDPEIWEGIKDIPASEIWRTHERRRERLVNFTRRRLQMQLGKRGASKAESRAAQEVLDPEALTIGFARRFATYKRATLMLLDPDRLVRILTNPERPVQILIAGKAHPADNHGKEFIRALVQFARRPEVRNHIVFIENYDINVARYMVQGVDCWLNTPKRPLEASGTSGMKAAANGALNISIPDGWWCEAEHLGDNGWSIGQGEMYVDSSEQDIIESNALYNLLEQDIVPAFYEIGRDGLPREWIRRMKTAIQTICPVFNTNRMVQEYTDRFYVPTALRRDELRADKRVRSKALCAWKARVVKAWSKVEVRELQSNASEGLSYGSELHVSAEVYLDGLTDEDVLVEIYFGHLDATNDIPVGKTKQMNCSARLEGNVHRFDGAIPCEKTGQQGFTVRVLPFHRDLAQKHEMALVRWAE